MERGRIHAALEALSEGVIVVDAQRRVVSANAASLRLLGLRREEVEGQRAPFPKVRAYYEDGTPIREETSRLRRVEETGEPEYGLVVRIEDDDASRWLSLNYTPIFKDDGELDGIVWSMVDITERREAEAAMLAEHDRAQRYLNLTSNMIVALDVEGRVTMANPRVKDLLGYSEEELLGQKWLDLVYPGPGNPAIWEVFRNFIAGDTTPAEYLETTAVGKSGQKVLLATHNTPIRDPEGKIIGTLSSAEDITERRRNEDEIAHLAYHDRLTGLPNRTLFEEQLGQAVAEARRAEETVALLFLDLDHFKLVNDSLGHAAGDVVLGMVADRLRAVTRESDLLARQGGDEFMLMLTGLGADPRAGIDAVVDKLQQALEAPFKLEGAEFEIGVSIGVSAFPLDAGSAPELLKNADVAMYQAKTAGRGRTSFYVAATDDPKLRLSLTTRLRRALAEEQFVLHYQPIFRLGDGSLHGMEALIRWQDPEEGLLPPARFIQFAEDTGLMGPIGDWVIDSVCAQARAWRDEGLTPSVSFNLSPRQLRGAQAATRLGVALEHHGLEPDCIVAELTETAAMADEAATRHALDCLRDLGVRMAIDDFGAGHSSLARLRDLDVHQLKIDGSFLRGVPDDGAAVAVVRAIVALAAGLGITTVAEWVETEQQRLFLVEAGCELSQGFHLARPMPASEASEFMRAVAPVAE